MGALKERGKEVARAELGRLLAMAQDGGERELSTVEEAMLANRVVALAPDRGTSVQVPALLDLTTGIKREA